MSAAPQNAMIIVLRNTQGRIQEFLKGGGPVKGRSPEPSVEDASAGGGPLQKIFLKLDAIFCNLAYIFGIRMASDIIQNGAFAEQKTVAATISIHTHAYTPTPHMVTRAAVLTPKTPRISATIKYKFNFKNIFSDIVYSVQNKIDFAKNRAPRIRP